MPTLQQILTDVKLRLPYSTASFTDANVISWMNSLQDEVWRYMASTEVYEFVTSTQAIYSMSTDMAYDMIKKVLISNSTTIDGTEGYTEYKHAGLDDEMDGNHYYDALGSLGIYPVPSAGYNAKVFYENRPLTLSTNTLTDTPSLNPEYHDTYKFRAMKIIAQSGNSPDVDLANNYQREEDALMKKIYMDYYKKKFKKPKETWDYKSGWYSG